MAQEIPTCAGECPPKKGAIETVKEVSILIRNDLLPPGDKVAAAANRVMAVMYQNCDAAKLYLSGDFDIANSSYHYDVDPNLDSKYPVIDSAAKFSSTHPYLALSCPRKTPAPPKCPDVCTTPTMYHYGARPYFGADPVQLMTPRSLGTKQKHYGIDCTAFVRASFLKAGFDIQPTNIGFQGDASSAVLNFGADPDDCFSSVDFKGGGIAAGDMVVWNGHALLIESVGKDPFGIADIKKVEDCKIGTGKIDSSKFDYNIIQSSNYGNRGPVGVSKISAKEFFGMMRTSSGYWMMQLAEKQCKAKFFKPSGKERADQIATESVLYNGEGGRKCAILRHKGKAQPQCVVKEKSLAYEECIGSCQPQPTPVKK